MAQGLFSIICGDLQNPALHRTLHNALKYPISLFNMSNAMDYIKRPDLVADLFASLNHTNEAKVITSSQVDGLEGVLGTFRAGGIHSWDEFVVILRRKELRDFFGQLL